MTSETSSKRHLFVCGCPRSGTSALQLLMASHPKIAMGGERYITGAFRTGLSPELFAKERFFDLRPGDTFYPSLDTYGAYYETQRAKFDDALWVGDKAPDYVWLLDQIETNFDRAHVLVIVRDPIDVAASYETRATNDADKTWNQTRDYKRAIAEWNSAQRRTLDFLERPGRRTCLTILDYSELFEAGADIESLFAQIDLDCPDVVRDAYENALAIGKTLTANRRPVLTKEQSDYVRGNADFAEAERLLKHRLLLAERKMISLLVPVLDEETAIPVFLQSVVPLLEAACRDQLNGGSYEIVFIDDGSTDRTADIVLGEGKLNPRVKLVRLSRNFGKEAALAAGFRYAAGDAVIPMDVDLQDPPEVIPRMIEEWLSGAEIVNAVRRRRDTDTWLKRVTARGFYNVYNRIAELPIKADVGDFRLLDRKVVDALNRLTEGSRFTKALYSWVGYVNRDIEYDRAGRASGETKWSYRRLFRFAIDGIIASTTAPLRVWSYVGLLMGFLAFLYAAIIVVRTLVLGIDVPGYASIIVAVLFLGGLNLLSLGIMGEYVGRIAQEVRDRPLYVVRETHGIAAEKSPHADPRAIAFGHR